DRARHDAPPENKKPPDFGRLRAAVVLALAARASGTSSRKELAENDDDERNAHENANARRWLCGSQGHTRPITSSRCHTRRASSSASTSNTTSPTPSARSGQPSPSCDATNPRPAKTTAERAITSPAICWAARLVFTRAATIIVMLPVVTRYRSDSTRSA